MKAGDLIVYYGRHAALHGSIGVLVRKKSDRRGWFVNIPARKLANFFLRSGRFRLLKEETDKKCP